MHRFITTIALSLLLALQLAACGGGNSTASPIPEAHAAAPASGCPTGDATAQLQAMVDTAQGYQALPPCVFNTSAPIIIRDPLRLVGSSAGVNGTIIRSSADEAVVVDPDVRISILLGWNQRGWWGSVENLRIEPAVDGAGKHALVFRVRKDFFISTWLIDRVHLGDFGEQGLYLDNSVANANGIFTGTVRNSFIENGIKAELVGDSITIADNVLPIGVSRAGKAALPGVDFSMATGTAKAVIRGNNVTGGGCIVVRNGIGVGVLNNWCESPSAGDSSGLIYLKDCAQCAVRDNRIQVQSTDVPYALVIDGGELTVIDSNEFNVGGQGHIAFVNGAKQNKLTGLNRFMGGLNVLTGKIDGAAGGLLTTP